MLIRRHAIVVIAAALFAGLCFSPVFGVGPLVVPLVVLSLVLYGVTELCRTRLVPWRPLLLLGAGLLVIIETTLWGTTVVGLPTAETLRALASGVDSWQVVLQSTWPANAEPATMLFVPYLVVLAGLLGIEIAARAKPLAAMLPSLVVVGISQLYVASSGLTAAGIACAYAVLVAVMLSEPSGGDRRRLAAGLAGLAAIAIVGGALAIAIDPAGRMSYSLRQSQPTDLAKPRLSNPLDEVASRLLDPETEVFRYKSDAAVSRWRLVVLDSFDGSNWTPGQRFLRLGSTLDPAAGIQVPVETRAAEVEPIDLTGPWLPSQSLPKALTGVTDAQIEPGGGALLAPERPQRYGLSWVRPQVDEEDLRTAGLDVGAVGEFEAAPSELASTAIGGLSADFQGALALERYLRDNHKLAVTRPLPTGHGWPQLQKFLRPGRSGTSEQFAAAYVALARLNGIPARLVVGFRSAGPADAGGWRTVRNKDVLAWPEVALDGIGWWPLDPAGQAEKAQGGAVDDGPEDEVTQRVRDNVPPPVTSSEADPPAEDLPADLGVGPRLPLATIGLVLLAIAVTWLVGVPVIKAVRAFRRRRSPAHVSVVGAWDEARDVLRAHGVVVPAGMTVRELTLVATDDEQVRRGLGMIATAVDQALWSGIPAGARAKQQAWDGVAEVRRGLRRRPWRYQAKAALEIGSLLPPQFLQVAPRMGFGGVE